MSTVPSKATSRPPRGRPRKAFHEDEDRYEVAFLEMCRRTQKYGRLPSTRRAAQLAALLNDFNVEPKRTSPTAPAQQLAPSGQRNSPANPSLRNGFDEYVYSHKRLRAGVEHSFAASIKRLERKHREWTKPGTPEEAWLDNMADAWMATTYPLEMRRKRLDPVKVCLTAAARVRELEFAQRYLLPLLRKRDAVEESKQGSTK